jgi:hypothetical protein
LNEEKIKEGIFAEINIASNPYNKLKIYHNLYIALK